MIPAGKSAQARFSNRAPQAPSPSAPTPAASPAAAATPTRRSCTALTPSGPARSAAKPSPPSPSAGGTPRCRCHAAPPQLHGPYAEWTRKIGGKTVTRRLTAEQLAAWQPLFDNARKLRDLLAELQELTLAIIEDSPARNHD